MSYEQTKALLDANINRADVKSRQAGGGVTLDYVDGFYVIKTLNEIIGQGNWQSQIQKLELVHKDEIDGKFTVHYLATVVLTANVGGHTVIFSDVGYGDGSDKKNAGRAHELAAKEAVTDAVKRCASKLGMKLGLALYDRNQEFVTDAEPEVVKPVAVDNTEAKKKLVRNAAKVLDSLKKLPLADFKEKVLKPNNATKVDDLSPDQTETVLLYLKNNYPELQLQ